MLKWIKEILNYRAKYLAAIESAREASANALLIQGRHESLLANLPYDHELSTRRHWQEYADHRLWTEHKALKRDLEHLRDAHCKMVQQWTRNIDTYGVKMYGNWQPIDLPPPKDGTIILAFGCEGLNLYYGIVSWDGEAWTNSKDETIDCISHWMHVPEAPHA